MDENKIFKLNPQAKDLKSKPSTLRPTTDNIQTNEIVPDIERKIPENVQPSVYPNYPLNQGNQGNKNKEINNPQKPTLLKLDSKSFIPKVRKKEENKDLKKGLENEEENKDENKKDKKDESTLSTMIKLNENAVEYKPRNIALKKKENIYLNKERESSRK